MNIYIVMADYAQKAPGGKISTIGAGWTKTSTPLAAHSVIIFVEAEDLEPESSYELEIKLTNSAGEIVKDPSDNEMKVLAELQTAAADLRGVVSAINPVIITLAPGVDLDPGIYAWNVASKDFPDHRWFRSFEVFRQTKEGVEPDPSVS